MVAIAALVGALWVGVGTAQDDDILIEGRVLGIAAEAMVVAPYALIAGGIGAINVDLSQVGQDQYAGLRTGDSVAVIGTVSRRHDRVIATWVQRLTS